MIRPSNYPDVKYKNNINSGVFLGIGFDIRYDQLSGLIIKGFAAPMDSALIKDVPSMITVSAFGCLSVVFVPCKRVSRSCDFVQEYNMPFCEMTEDSLKFLIVKIPANHIFGFGVR